MKRAYYSNNIKDFLLDVSRKLNWTNLGKMS